MQQNNNPLHFIEVKEWKEYHPNGQLWITGQIAVVKQYAKHLYDYRVGFKGYEGTPVVRLGIWTKYFENGQLAWQLDYSDGLLDSKTQRKKLHSYREDGSAIVSY